ncbi:MAG TPA: ABC transporter permease subunit [Ktedonobacterales bacterium]|jgi:hypothetical protein
MTWLVWRQHRGEALIASIGLGILAAVLIITGIQIASAFQSLGVAACVAHPELANCNEIERGFAEPYSFLTSALPWLNLLPAFVAILIGAPLVAREFEHGTHRLAWTQSVTRWRWLAIKLGLVLLGCVLLSAIVTALLTWWRWPFDQIGGRFDPQAFNFEGAVPLAYMLFAVALAIAVGALLGRSIPAMVVTLVVFTAARLGIQSFARPNFLPPITRVFGLNDPDYLNRYDWVLDQGWVDSHGNQLHGSAVLRSCEAGAGAKSDILQCIRAHGLQQFVTFQPADRFWLFQGIEAAIFCALAAICVVVTFWLVKRRPA